MGILSESWSSFSPEEARSYLRPDAGGRETHSRRVLLRLLKRRLRSSPEARILDVGCGNGNLYGDLCHQFPRVNYTGIDVSGPLLAAARERFPQAVFVEMDCESLLTLRGTHDELFDTVVYSHVLEMIESPETSLIQARQIARSVLIEFFEPPSKRPDRVELLTMDLGNGPTPYLRRQVSLDVYLQWVSSAGFAKVDRFFTRGKYEVHLLS